MSDIDQTDRRTVPLDTDRWTVRIAIVVAIGMLVGGLFTTWHEATYGGPVPRVAVGTDFAIFHGAAVLTLEGDGASSYNREALGEKVGETTGYLGTGPGYGHPPFFALLLAPFALLPFGYAYVLFVLGGTVALALAVAKTGGVRTSYAVALALISMPGFATVQLGQMGIWVAALLFAVYVALRNNRLFVAGLLLGLLAFKPLYAIGIGLWWLMNWRRYGKAIAGAACTAAALGLVGFAVPGGWSGFFSVRFLDGVHRSGFSVLEMWRSLIPIPAVAFVAWVLCLACIVVVFRRLTAECQDRLAVGFSLAVILGLLITLRVGWYDWVLLVVPGVLLWSEVPEGRKGLVSAGAALFPVAALSWPLARLLDRSVGIYVQVAPIALAALTWWWFANYIRPTHEAIPAPANPAVQRPVVGGTR